MFDFDLYIYPVPRQPANDVMPGKAYEGEGVDRVKGRGKGAGERDREERGREGGGKGRDSYNNQGFIGALDAAFKMASISNVPREFESGIRDAVGPNTKIYIKRIMKLEVKPEKYEKRVVALAGCRLMILTAKVQTKVEQNISYLDIQALESKKENQLSVTIDNKTLNFVTLDAETDDVNLIITHIGRSIKNVFPAFPLERFIRTIEVHPPGRLKTMYDLIRDVDHKETGPCGGFSMMYACMCDYYNLPYREEVAWDVDTIYLSQDSRELCLQDFDHLNSKDLIPIVSALEHNTWFTKLNANDVKLNMETQNEIQKVMLRNAVIEELHLSNTGITADFVSKLATAVLSNAGSQLSKVDLSKNTLSDQALISFIGSLKNLSKGLVSFNMASTKVTGKGLNKIAETLSNNPNITLTLQYLNMSDNPNPKGDDLQSLYSLLAQPNNLTHLDLSGIDCSLESLCGALLRGSCPSLTHLYVSRNVFSQRKGKEVIPQGTWKTFFSSVYGLEILDLSSCRLPPEALKELLLGIASNINLKNLDLDLSNNDLQMPGAAILGDSLSNITSVTSLDVSNNGFEQSLEKFLDAMKANSSVKHLAIGQNFSKVKNPPMVLESVVNLIQDENSTIESLSLADSKLKNHLSVVINALGSNTTLTEIDISGNSVGDLGARMLSKALQINNKLRSILWDRNNVGPQGFEDVANALKKNFTVKKMPSPLTDIGKVLEERKDNTKERTEAAIKEIESALQRNHSPQKYSSDQGYRLQQGFLISSTQQMVDRLVVQVQDTINALGRLGSGESHQGDVDKASCVIKDADNSKQLLPQLQNIAMKSCDVGNPIEKQLQQMAADLKEVLNKQMKKTVSEMVECTTNQCAGVTADKTFMEELVGGCSEKSSLPPHFTKNVLDSVETSVYNKLSELNLAVAAYISDKTLEGVIEALHSSHKTLVRLLSKSL
ncbi:hypothetical protein FSP39_000718 [Pinctada imbricata]|uniref:Uncharacterized protein n=1 Tax=Pinctada imbricata TaxID=66713 RepID=A0AA88XHG6_PINIB|nr:hypothetical protein FSP39_000718 [Pinctada imbricata]